MKKKRKKFKKSKPEGLDFGAATRIRTGDLILTKDVLYQLSHSSVPQECFLVTLTIIANIFSFVNTFLKNYKNIFLEIFEILLTNDFFCDTI